MAPSLWWIVTLFCVIPCSAISSLKTICADVPANGIIDESFQGCRSPPLALAGRRDVLAYSFRFGQDSNSNTSLRILARSMQGAVTISILNDNKLIGKQGETRDGPSEAFMLRPNMDYVDSDFYLEIANAYSSASKFVLEVNATDVNLVANAVTKRAVTQLYKECCNTTVNRIDATWDGATLMPCDQLYRWSISDENNLNFDVCQSSRNLCNPDGSLDTLGLIGGLQVMYDMQQARIPPAFEDKCIKKPPAALSNFPMLTHLDMSLLGLQWTVPDVVTALSTMTKLERLYLAGNSITGELNASACSLFKNSPLKSLSFRAIVSFGGMRVSPPLNAISGDIHGCVWDSSLENLNLMFNQVSGIAPVPAGSTSPLKSLIMVEQHNPMTGKLVMQGKGMPQGLDSLKQLSVLDLAFNNLGGRLDTPLPATIEWLDLASNGLTGSFPKFSSLSSLNILRLAHNPGLTGDISDLDIEDVTGLSYLELSNTSLAGNPNKVDWKKLPGLETLVIEDADLQGEVPASLASLQYLQQIDLSNNEGIMSQAAFGDGLTKENNITVYDVSNCSIEDLPDGLQNLGFFMADTDGPYDKTYLFDISNNKIEATLPDWLADPMPMKFLDPQKWLTASYLLSVQSEKDTNRIVCPWQPVAAEKVEDAVTLQNMWLDYDSLVTCYNGTQLVPVATYLTWLQERGPLPAPPPGTSRVSAPGSKMKLSASGESKKSGPSPGVLAGIAIGVLVGTAVLAALIFKLVRIIIPKMKNKNFVQFKEGEDAAPGGATGPYGDPDQFQMTMQAPMHGPNTV